jgi:hypothetical protein
VLLIEIDMINSQLSQPSRRTYFRTQWDFFETLHSFLEAADLCLDCRLAKSARLNGARRQVAGDEALVNGFSPLLPV